MSHDLEGQALDQPSFSAYRGTDPFLFVSYSHADDRLVRAELVRLGSLGFNCWYDDGISAGKTWADEIAHRIAHCSVVLYFVSPNSASSRHCRNEIHYALQLGKPILKIELRPTTLPPGLSMQLTSVQGILKHQLSESRYVEKLEAAVRDLLDLGVSAVTGEALPKLPMGVVTLMRMEFIHSLHHAIADNDQFVDLSLRWQNTMREAGSSCGGFEIESNVDVCFYAFTNPMDAVFAAIRAQESWTEDQRRGVSSVRVALHTGQPRLVNSRYYGVDVLRVTQIATIGAGGQVMMSSETRALVHQADLPDGIEIRDLGLHKINDLPYPETLHDLAIASLNSDFEPVASLTNRPTNLPTVMTKFVGRKRELNDICEFLKQAEVRLLTLTGPGGTGKTRLSIESAKMLAEQFHDGVYLVQLASISDPNLIIPTIAGALGLVVLPGQTPMESLVQHSVSLRMLLVLDNFEQIIEGATILMQLLDACPGVKVIASSREPLELRVEKLYPVEPLPVPGRNPDLRAGPLEEIESVKLFLDRAQDLVPDFSINPDNEEDIVAICIKLEGLPLALELAASRLNVLSPSGLLENLEKSFDILKSRSRDLPDRQRTLHSTVNWSYELLSEQERSLFRKFSVFSGGGSLPALQFIAAGEHGEVDVIDGIESLIRKSLLKQDLSLLEPRYWMLESVREFGRKLLDGSADCEEVLTRHHEYFLALAESLAPGLVANQQRQSITRLTVDADNIRASLSRVIERRDCDRTSRFLQALLWMWIPRGYFAEGKEWVTRALHVFQDSQNRYATALVREVGAWLEIIGGGYQTARPDIEQALAAFQEAGHDSDIARAKISLGMTKTVLGIPGGLELSQEGWAYYQESDDDYGIGLALITLGTAHFVKGEVESASAHWQEALRIFRKIGNTFWTCRMLLTLAFGRMQELNWQEPANLMIEAMNIAREYEYPMILHESVALSGGIAMMREMPTQAVQLFGFVEASCARFGVSLEPMPLEYMQANLADAKEQLTPDSFREAFQTGANWSDRDIQAAVTGICTD